MAVELAAKTPTRERAADDCRRTSPTDITPSKSELSPVAWIPGRQLTYEDWLRLGSRLGVAGRGAGWWLGDWLRYGTASYGSKYTAAVRVTGYDRQTLMNMVYVAARFPISRRREGLSWSHHAEVAGLELLDQEHWLKRAALERLTVRELRLELVSARRRLPGRDAAPEENEQGSTPGREPAAATQAACASPAPAESATVEAGELLTCPHCGRTFSGARPAVN